MNVSQEASDLVDLADEVAREVDHVRGEVAERARAGLGAVEAPHLRVRVAPVLEVAATEVPDLAELARVDELARQPHRRHEAVVERAQVLDPGRGDAAPDLVALVGGSRPSGFSQTTCLPASAAAIVGSAWSEFGPRLSKSPMSGSATRSSQAVVQRSNP